jgi:predicted nucleotidyltransferase
MFKTLLAEIARELDGRRIPYMIIGGQAVLVYGEPRMTRDIDVTLGVGTERLGEILEATRKHHWRVLSDDPMPFVQRTMVLPCIDEASGIRLDFIFSFSPYERQAMDRIRRVDIDGTSVRFASPEDLIIHKIVAGRPRDLEDARIVLLKNPDMDSAYIRHWLGQFERALAKPLIPHFEDLSNQG